MTPRLAVRPVCRPARTARLMRRVTLWLRNGHAAPIPRSAVALDRMRAGASGDRWSSEIGPFATVAVDVGAIVPSATVARAN